MARATQRQIGFNQGIIAVASYLVKTHGEETLAECLLRELSPDLKHADVYDLGILKDVIAELHRKM